jgi:hypothetical protein
MTFGQNSLIWICPKNVMKEDTSKNVKLNTYWKKKKSETRNKMERRRTHSYKRMWSSRWRLGGQTLFEIGCRKTLYFVERLIHTETVLLHFKIEQVSWLKLSRIFFYFRFSMGNGQTDNDSCIFMKIVLCRHSQVGWLPQCILRVPKMFTTL